MTKKFTTQRQTKPITFELDEETFTCRPEIPGTLLLEYAEMIGQDNVSVSAKVVLDFFKAVMRDEEHARFRKFTDSPDNPVNIQVLGEIVEYLLGEYAQRPTQPSSP